MNTLISAIPGLKDRQLQAFFKERDGKVLLCPRLVEGPPLGDPTPLPAPPDTLPLILPSLGAQQTYQSDFVSKGQT